MTQVETETAAVTSVRCGCAHPHRLADVSELGGVHVRATLGRRHDASLHTHYVFDLVSGRLLIHCPHSHEWQELRYDERQQRVRYILLGRTARVYPQIGCTVCDRTSSSGEQHRAPAPGAGTG